MRCTSNAGENAMEEESNGIHNSSVVKISGIQIANNNNMEIDQKLLQR
jgi:hypothetical protein